MRARRSLDTACITRRLAIFHIGRSNRIVVIRVRNTCVRLARNRRCVENLYHGDVRVCSLFLCLSFLRYILYRREQNWVRTHRETEPRALVKRPDPKRHLLL